VETNSLPRRITSARSSRLRWKGRIARAIFDGSDGSKNNAAFPSCSSALGPVRQPPGNLARRPQAVGCYQVRRNWRRRESRPLDRIR
jgi:hypothetical protein